MRVLLLTNIPTPYNIPVFRRVSLDSGWRLTVCYVSSTNREAAWPGALAGTSPEYETRMLDQEGVHWERFLGTRLAATRALLARLRAETPDYLIVCGYRGLPQVAALVWAIAAGTRFAVLGDSNIYADCAAGIKRRLKQCWLGFLTRRAAALIAIGTANRRFWESYGARPEKLFHAPFAVDNELFARAGAARRAEAAAMLQRLGIAGRTVFIYVGRLVKSKGVDLIIRAARRLPAAGVALIIVGDGPERQALQRLARGSANIVFAGPVANQDLPVYYAMAGALVLPSDREPWGLVVNEAMASGLAIIAHRHCGATVDLVGKENGVVLESFSVDELEAAMGLIASDGLLRQRMQSQSRQAIQDWSIPGFACGIIHAVESSLCR